uniref:Uncharacterized protein n=1 Tax=Utricularia reniformis TaxID=192314 RepID=A0A1Y0AZJ7_9LAMI|nr:hypothetical protein AEK19_MT0334 [Utricularia reniformis]ART30606.1 hypothetical protein AEK19_MT0334 [Utricularia reniformis]
MVMVVLLGASLASPLSYECELEVLLLRASSSS